MLEYCSRDPSPDKRNDASHVGSEEKEYGWEML